MSWLLAVTGLTMALAAVLQSQVNAPLLAVGVIALVAGLALAAGDLLADHRYEADDEGSEWWRF